MGITTRNILESDLPTLENISKSAIKAKQKFERLVLPKETLLEMFNVRPTYPAINLVAPSLTFLR
jgi:threonyl-tRNA synthetase